MATQTKNDETTTAPPPVSEDEAPATSATDDEALGEAGLKALQAERKAHREAAARVRELEQQMATQAEEAAKAAMSEQERAVAEAVESAVAEALAEVNSRLVAAEVKLVAATKRLRNPDDAASLLDLSGLDHTADDFRGTVEAKIDELLADRPYLADDGKPKFNGESDQGTKPKATLTEADMTPQERLRAAYSN